MSTPNIPVPIDGQLPIDEDLMAVQFTEGLPLLLVTLLERRYLTNFQYQNWRIEPREDDTAYPVLREIVGLGKPQQEDQWVQSMPYALTACHEPGHALVMVLHGQGDRHRLYFGGRRIIGEGARSSEDYLLNQESALKAYFSGLTMSNEGMKRLDRQDLPEIADLLQSAPALAMVTGIPSGRGGQFPLGLQSLDHLSRAVGSQHFVLMVVAEPLDAQVIDQTLDACRHLKSEIHSYVRRNISHSKGKTETVSQTDTHAESNLQDSPIYLRALTQFLSQFLSGVERQFLSGVDRSQVNPKYRLAIVTLSAALSAGSILFDLPMTQTPSQQMQSGTSWGETGSLELLDANAEVCEQLLQRYIERLTAGRSDGWWQTSIYLAAESEAAQYSVLSALRSLASGNASALDPLRVINLPTHLLRGAIERGQILTLHPDGDTQGHPLGEAFNTLATCLNSEELAVVVNLPQEELPGLPMRTHSDFALSVPSPAPNSISLGTLQDSLRHNLETITLTSEELNRHCFVTGLTGYGKTNTCMQILLEAYDKLKVPFLVLEPAKTEYRRLARIPELQGKLRVYSIGGESPLPFRLNPLNPVPGIPLGRHVDLLKAVFNASFPMFAGMPYVLEEAILDIYTMRGWSLYTSQNPFLSENAALYERSALMPSLQDLHDQIEVVLARKKYGQEVHQNMGAALRARLQSLMKGNKGMALNTLRSVPLDDLFAGPAVIELQNLGDDEEKAFVLALLFTLLYEYAEVRRQNVSTSSRGTLQHLTLVEEAHRLLQSNHGPANPELGDPRSKAVAMFTDMLAEMRAYGEGFIIADQIPTKLVPETLKNSNLKIVHRLVAPDDRQVIGSCMNLNDQQVQHLNNLAPGFAVLHNERIGEAVLAKIYPVKENRILDQLEELEEVRPMMKREEKIYLYRHAGCRCCPSPCDFYYRVEEANNQAEMAAMLQPFLESFLLDDIVQVWTLWTRWRTEWCGHSVYTMLDNQDKITEGVLYCLTSQIIYDWLGSLLVDRGSAIRKERKFLPQDRILREQVARILSELILDWTKRTRLDEEGRRIFTEVHRQVEQLLIEAPPQELTGCQSCPIRCRMLPFVAPYVMKLEKVVTPIVTPKGAEKLSASSRLEVIRCAAEQQIPLMARRKNDNATYQGLLYCLLTNTQVSAAASNSRDELLALLR